MADVGDDWPSLAARDIYAQRACSRGYGGPMPDPFVATAETHSAIVVFVGPRAYKVKRPVVLDFLDFGTAAKREAACVRELELNRRLAPDVYLGVARLSDPTGGPDEPVLVMQRMPEDYTAFSDGPAG